MASHGSAATNPRPITKEQDPGSLMTSSPHSFHEGRNSKAGQSREAAAAGGAYHRTCSNRVEEEKQYSSNWSIHFVLQMP
jgi:hypothetical protein